MQVLEPTGDDEDEVLALTYGEPGNRKMETLIPRLLFSLAIVIVTLLVSVTFLFTIPQLILIMVYVSGQAGYGAGEYELQRTLDLMQ
jgi:hypothetical protein